MSIEGEVETTLQSLHKWEIPRVCLNCREANSRIFSPCFTAHGVKWSIIFYPKSETEEDQEYCSIYLKCITTSEIKVAFDFSILNQQNIVYFSARSSASLFNEKNTSWGMNKFIKNSKLFDKNDQILKDSKLTVLCKISDAKSHKTKNYETHEPDSEQNTDDFGNYEKYFLNERLSDVQFRIDKEIIFAHKFVLATRSEVFAAMFTHDMKENEENKVEIKDFNCQVFKEMLRYIYTGGIDKIETIVDDLLLIADKYMLEGLTKICENNLIKNLSNENVLDYLMFANKYNLSRLKKMAIIFIASNLSELLTTNI